MKTFLKISILLCLSIGLFSCKGNNKKLLPNVSGKAGEVVVVLDKEMWKNKLGQDIRASLGKDYPYLPQKEPLYSLVNVSPTGFTDMFKIHRNIVIFNIKNDIEKDTILYKENIWAYPQCIVQVNANSYTNADSLFNKNENNIINYIETAERDRVIANSIKYQNEELYDKVADIMGGSPRFPIGYKLKKITKNFIWIQQEDKQTTIEGILIYKYPITSNNNFMLDSLIKHRNEILKENVPGMRDNSWMTTSTYMRPSLEFMKYKGRRFAQMRGFWDVHNDYMGGPFVSQIFYSQDGKDLIVLDGFVYAPKYDKRHYMRQVESILYSFTWKDEKKD